MGALAHLLEIHFLPNSGTLAVTAFATLELQTFLEQHFQAYFAADITSSSDSVSLERKAKCSPNDKVTI